MFVVGHCLRRYRKRQPASSIFKRKPAMDSSVFPFIYNFFLMGSFFVCPWGWHIKPVLIQELTAVPRAVNKPIAAKQLCFIFKHHLSCHPATTSWRPSFLRSLSHQLLLGFLYTGELNLSPFILREPLLRGIYSLPLLTSPKKCLFRCCHADAISNFWPCNCTIFFLVHYQV